jgi:thiamine pyrophosphate-dependent acetolactate synthase large subunit-like protein
MSRNVADVLCEMLANAGVKRCYGIVGDAETLARRMLAEGRRVRGFTY